MCHGGRNPRYAECDRQESRTRRRPRAGCDRNCDWGPMARPTGRREGEASRSAAPPTAVVAGEPSRAWFGRLRPGPSAHTRAEAQALVEQISRLLLDTPTKEWRL